MPAAAHPAVTQYARHVNPALVKMLGVFGYGRVFVRARDVSLWDDRGTEYLDFLAGFGAVNLGHNHPRLIQRLREFLAEDPVNLVHTGPAVHAAELAAALASRLDGGLEVSLFSSSGSEAIDAALKLARAATGRTGHVYCTGGFSGTSLGALSVMGGERFRRPFGPLVPGGEEIPFGDLAALERVLSSRPAAAFVVEPIQAEGGVVLPPAGYLAEAGALCRRHGTLFVLDEVQTGLGRTGTLFAHQAEGVVPDVLVLAKALGGGIAPAAVTVTRLDIHQQAYGSMQRFDLHGSTFAGNALACVAALETLAVLDEEKLAQNSAARGEQLLDGLQRRLAGHPLVRDIRGRGLLVGIELGLDDSRLLARVAPEALQETFTGIVGQWIALQLLERRILCQPAAHRWNVVKLEPPLTVQPAQVDRAVAAVADVFDASRDVATLVKDITARVGRQALKGWTF
jgi:putrescine aminotransferase